MVVFPLQLLPDTVGFAKWSNQTSNFPHQKINTFKTCVQRAHWLPKITSVSLAAFQPILESLSPSALSAHSALIFPSKPIINLSLLYWCRRKCTTTWGWAKIHRNSKSPSKPLHAMSHYFWLFHPSTYNFHFFTRAFWMLQMCSASE